MAVFAGLLYRGTFNRAGHAITSHTNRRMSVDRTCPPPEPPKGGQTLLRQELLLLSESETWDSAKCEWQLLGCHWSNTEGRCLCRHPIKERCIIENMGTKKQATVGSCCVRQFLVHLAGNTDAVFASIKRVHGNDTKSLHVDVVDLAEAHGAIAPWAADLYNKLLRKRVLSGKQAQFRQRMNTRILNHAAHLANVSDGSSAAWPIDEATLAAALNNTVIDNWENSFYSNNLGNIHVTEKQKPIKQRIEAKIEAWARAQDATSTAC